MACEKAPTQQQGIAVTMTVADWRAVQQWLQYGSDYHAAKGVEWMVNCQDKRVAAGIVAEHEAAAAEAERLYKIIEETIMPPKTPETEQTTREGPLRPSFLCPKPWRAVKRDPRGPRRPSVGFLFCPGYCIPGKKKRR